MEKMVFEIVMELINALIRVFGGNKLPNPRTRVLRISEIHPLYANFDTPASRSARLGLEDRNLDFELCEEFKGRCNPIAFFPGKVENGFPFRQYPIYLVVPWGVESPSFAHIRGLILFNRVMGPDRIEGPCFDNEPGQWGAILAKDEIVLRNLPYQTHDKTLRDALGEKWQDISWLKTLLEGKNLLCKLK